MARLTTATLGERRYRPFTILADGVAADLTGITVTLYMKKAGELWSTATSVDTSGAELVITDAANGIIELRPSATWFNKAGDYKIKCRVATSPAYDTDEHHIEVIDAP